MRQAQSAKKGVDEAGGTPREFCTITVTDGIAMGHQGMKSSLVSREVIADSIELTMRGHCYDALVGIAGCDKSLPGMMMAMLRLNVPSVFMYGGSILPGRFKGQDVTVVDVFEGVGMHSAGKHVGRRAARARVRRLSVAPAPAAASSPPTPWPACRKRSVWRCRLGRRARRPTRAATHYAVESGEAVMRLLARRHPSARHLHAQGLRERGHRRRRHRRLDQRRRCICRPWRTSAASSSTCSTSPRSSSSTPYIADLKPGGKYVAKDVYDIGGVPQIMKALLDGGSCTATA